MKNDNDMKKTSNNTDSIGVTEMQKKVQEEYRIVWEEYFVSMRRLLYKLPCEKHQEFEEWFAEGRCLISWASQEVTE